MEIKEKYMKIGLYMKNVIEKFMKKPEINIYNIYQKSKSDKI